MRVNSSHALVVIRHQLSLGPIGIACREKPAPASGTVGKGDGDKPNAVLLQGADVVQAVHQGAAKPVQFPDQETIEFPCLGVLHQTIAVRPSGLGPAHDVLVGFHDAPALAFSVGLEFPDLPFTVLI